LFTLKETFAISVQFLGTNFYGSQKQAPTVRTVQGELEKALSIFFKTNIQVVFASRVDAGVHAKAMIGHFRLDPISTQQNILNPELERKFCLHFNGLLPNDISVLGLKKVPNNFHAIKDAISRTYIYKLRIGGQRNPLDESQIAYFHNPKSLNIENLNELCLDLIGEKDFLGLSNKSVYSEKKPICHITNCFWRQSEEDLDLFTCEITANRFLYNMIRIIIGTQIAVTNGKLKCDTLKNALEYKDSQFVASKAPAKGLCLKVIKYPFPLFDQ
jgi:tRNA pseudouridine38-40 synthase